MVRVVSLLSTVLPRLNQESLLAVLFKTILSLPVVASSHPIFSAVSIDGQMGGTTQ
jgi:hypothetical protein